MLFNLIFFVCFFFVSINGHTPKCFESTPAVLDLKLYMYYFHCNSIKCD